MKIFLDTDIGTDSDDALCLAYLLNKPECELLGITTVGCQAPQRAEIVDSLCHHAGCDEVPIAAGADRPYTPNCYWDGHRLSYYGVTEQWPARQSYARGEAMGLMQRVIRENPGEVVLLAVGPLTNVGLLAAADPEAMGMLKALYIMGGFNNDRAAPRCECNIMLDPTSASSAFAAETAQTRVCSLQVTRGQALTGEQVERNFGDQRFAPLVRCIQGWAEMRPNGGKGVGMHDPMTAMAIFDPDICQWARGRVTVKILDEDPSGRVQFQEDQVTGVTFFDPADQGPHTWAVEVDRQRMLDELFGTLGCPDAPRS